MPYDTEKARLIGRVNYVIMGARAMIANLKELPPEMGEERTEACARGRGCHHQGAPHSRWDPQPDARPPASCRLTYIPLPRSTSATSPAGRIVPGPSTEAGAERVRAQRAGRPALERVW
jgi:hypothetical protein